jgi:hypothetical protein
MAEPAKALQSVPSAAEIDALAILYNEEQVKVLDAILATRAAQKALEDTKDKCVELVRKFGSAHAQKSKLVHGLKWEIMGTFGASTSIDAAAVERLRVNLQESKQTRLLKRLFESSTRWVLKSTARAEILKPGVGDDVRAAFAVCEVTKDNSPKIEARLKKPA